MSQKNLAPSELGERAPQRQNNFGKKSDIMFGSRKSPDVPGRGGKSPKGVGVPQNMKKVPKNLQNIKKHIFLKLIYIDRRCL